MLAVPKTRGAFCFQSSFVVTPKALLGGRPCRVTLAALMLTLCSCMDIPKTIIPFGVLNREFGPKP